ncbi:MAG: sugar ABC transporter permease, partial [Clostridia bacterium]
PAGIINQVLALFGITGPNWLLDSRTSLISVALVTVWKSIGYYCLIIIAGLQSLPKDVFEAAKLDKANKATIFRKITVPLLAPTLSFVFIMKFINSFKSFATIDIMTQGGPQGSSMVLGYWIYTEGRVKFNYGFSMAGAVVMTIIVAGFVILSQYLMNRKDKEGDK